MDEKRSESEVVGSVLAGNRDDFTVLVRNHQSRIYSMIRRQVGEEQVAEELTQDVFASAYRALSGFRSEAQFSTWLTRIALNRTNTYFTSFAHRQRKNAVPIKEFHLLSGDFSESQENSTDEDLVRLQETLGKLKSIHREVVILCCIENRSYDEAAEILQIPVGTVGSRLNKAFQQLRKSFWQS